MIQFTAHTLNIEASEGGERRITGLAVPYGVDATVLGGRRVRIEAGALPVDGPSPRLLAEHDPTRVIGIVDTRISTDEGMEFSARIAKTREGDDILELLQMGALDSVSVGVNPTDSDWVEGTLVVKAAEWEELSVVFQPAFRAARIEKVAASDDAALPDNPEPQPASKEEPMPENEAEIVEASAPESIPTPVVFAKPRTATLPALSDYIEAAREGGSRWAQLNDQIRAATGDVVVSDAAGLVPTPVVTPYYDEIDAMRPVVSALGVKALPSAGSTFLRPYVSSHTAAAVQSSELAGLNSADFALTNKTFTKKTFGSTNILSEQVIDWSTPSMLDAVVRDQASAYALVTEKYAIDQMAAAITNTQEVIVTDFTDSTEVIGDLYTAAASIAATGNYFPNALVMAPTMWAKLGSLVDGQGRPLFPQASPVNSAGLLPGGVTAPNGNPLGLTLVVSNQITDQAVGNKDANEYFWMLNTRGVEFYEDYKGFLQITNAATLGVQISVRGYVACEVLDVNMIRILGPDATF